VNNMDLGAETAQGVGVTEPVLVDGLMDDAHPIGLCERRHER